MSNDLLSNSPQGQKKAKDSSAPDFNQAKAHEELKGQFEKLSNFQNLMVLAVFLGFVTMVAEVGFLVCEAFWHKQESFTYLIEKSHQQEAAIQELQRYNTARKK